MSLRTLDSSMPFPALGDNAWQRDAIERLLKVFPRLKTPHVAAAIVRRGSRVVEYFEQAPCLLVIGTSKKCSEAMLHGQPLKVVMKMAGGSRVLRKLHGAAVMSAEAVALRRLAELNPSLVSQAIPDDASRQRMFINACEVDFKVDPAGKLPKAAWDEWFVSRSAPLSINHYTIIDFLTRSQRAFDPSWSAAEALAAAKRWHGELARMGAEERFFEKHGLAFEDEIEYGGFPNEGAASGYGFVALRSGASLFEDGRIMHHCVGSYSSDVIGGKSRIYSVRQADRRIATLEFKQARGQWTIRQLCGPCNARPDEKVMAACVEFAKGAIPKNREPRRAAA